MINRQIIGRTFLLCLLCVFSVGAYVLYEHELYFCAFFSGLFLLAGIAYLAYSPTVAMRRWFRMVEAIRYGDFSLNFATDKRQTPEEQQMIEDINEVMAQLRVRLTEKEERFKYLETLLDTVDASMLIVDKLGYVQWMNRAGVQELCGHTIHHLDELQVLNRDFVSVLESLQPGEVKVVRIYKEDMMQDMAVTVTDYSNSRVELRLVNLKNIRSVLEENEMEAWQKLVRVLTHEIMNSITPIISLSDTLCERAVQQGMDESSLMLQGMQTIHRRSKGLLNFVENYRKLSRLSSPMLAPVCVGDLLGDIKKLFTSSNVHFVYRIEDEAQVLMADRSQMEQVLINLLKNACEACAEQEHPEVVVATSFDKEKRIFRLSVTDNGCGILPEVLDRIFIPFFTTKPTGSGIGLSLCKQIVTLHGGSLQAASEVGKGSCFTLKLWVK